MTTRAAFPRWECFYVIKTFREGHRRITVQPVILFHVEGNGECFVEVEDELRETIDYRHTGIMSLPLPAVNGIRSVLIEFHIILNAIFFKVQQNMHLSVYVG